MLAKDPGSHLLNDALLASGLIIVGRSTEDLSMVQAAIELENRVISSLRARLNNASQEIYPQEQHRLTTVVFTIAIAELLAKKSWRAFSLHLKGVGALIEACGPGSLDSQFAIEQFYAYRAVLVPFCFLDRRPSFVCRREWISFPLRNEFEIKYPALEKLVEIILEIPVLIQRFDEQVASEDPRKAVLQLLERARVVCQDMDSWETDSQLQFPWTKPGRRTLFPLRELQVSGRMQLSDTLTANLASFYLGAKVAIHDLCLAAPVLRPQRQKWRQPEQRSIIPGCGRPEPFGVSTAFENLSHALLENWFAFSRWTWLGLRTITSGEVTTLSARRRSEDVKNWPWNLRRLDSQL
ncbi:hypothetical protein PRZ48_008452 [Zasmidium cellare]|uniref:Uncharacterized protein n=1 Tax=Zasmidium cellare TaxID=395010 RepID=A0ABR0EGM0_ZASCE|nr:hypothetical protein PRZ48_008452 [Zasmidium cellare]